MKTGNNKILQRLVALVLTVVVLTGLDGIEVKAADLLAFKSLTTYQGHLCRYIDIDLTPAFALNI